MKTSEFLRHCAECAFYGRNISVAACHQDWWYYLWFVRGKGVVPLDQLVLGLLLAADIAASEGV